jgi:hypothetical protein
MRQHPNDRESQIRANPPRKLQTGFTGDKPTPGAGRAASPMRRYKWIVLTCLVLAVAAASAAFWYWAEYVGIHPNSITVGRMDRMLSADLPPGSTREQVKAWLESRNIKYFEEPRKWIEHWTGAYPRINELPIDAAIEARIPDANVSLFSPGFIDLLFCFDRNGKLLMHIVHPQVPSSLP